MQEKGVSQAPLLLELSNWAMCLCRVMQTASPVQGITGVAWLWMQAPEGVASAFTPPAEVKKDLLSLTVMG